VYWDDLVAEVTEAQAEGNQVIFMAGMNKDVEGVTTQKHIRKLGLVEAIMKLHKTKPPPMHQRGQEPIDKSLYHLHYWREQNEGI